jgi:tetratricopeptide (TPR) repeat protein
LHPTRWSDLSPLLDELLDLAPAARPARLVELRARDAALADALEELLSRLTTLDRGFLDAPPPLPERALSGHVIGPYTIERELGRGGMGSVWLARRTDGRFEGHVAVKVLAGPLHGRGAIERFEREGRLLGRLAHPNIARLLDAGVDGGQPYLILEYVDGEPLDQWCDAQGLDVPGRVRLFLAVLAAVAHAHARLILHRDLKPSNILVSREGVPKLLDFGIGKLLEDPTQPGAETDLTRIAGRAYTPRYAAPEQIEGGDVTTATDVYALGVLLYLLLSGVHPTDAGEETSTLMQLRALVDTVPRRMSQAAERAGGTPASRARALRGDLDTIVAKALEKRPGDRYANAALLAEDLLRWLNHEPIAARPDAALYRIAKLVRRHRVGAAATGLVLAATAVGVAGTLWQARQAEKQREQAEGLIEYMLGDLRGKLAPVGRLDALEGVGAQALAYYAAQDERRLDANSLLRRSRALQLLGEIAETRGRLDEAQRVFASARQTTGELLDRAPGDGERVFAHAQSEFWVGLIGWRQGRLDDAEQAFLRYEAMARRLVALDAQRPEWQAELAYAQQNLGTVLLDAGRLDPARERLGQAVQTLRTLVGTSPALRGELANTLGWLARANARLGRLAEAARVLDEAITLQQGAATGDVQAQAGIATALSQLAAIELQRGRVREAAEQATRAIDAQEALLRREPANTLWRQELAWAQLRRAEAQLLAGDAAGASATVGQASRGIASLIATDRSVASWRQTLPGYAQLLAAQSAAPAERPEALDRLQRWLAEHAEDAGDAPTRLVKARAALLLGDAARDAGRGGDAGRLWRMAATLGAAPAGAALEPQLAVHAARAWLRLGEPRRSRAAADAISRTEFRHAAYADLVDQLARDAAPPTQGAP